MKNKPTSTKSKILSTTLDLLNKQGLSNVKMRDVSNTLGISIGNLTYHYPKWENLMDGILIQFYEDIKGVYYFFPKKMSEVVEYIERIYDLQMKYTFFFSNIHIFFQQFPKYKDMEEEFFVNRMTVMREAFDKMIEKNYLYPKSSEHNYDLLVKTTWLILSGWYSFSVIFKEEKYNITKKEFFFTVWGIYSCHLTESGKEIIRKSYTKLLYKKEPNLWKMRNNNAQVQF